ncbi:xanthine dehydrogenase accessory factor [Acrocarpospora corrugata]|uniref:Xanthine dehydrogenase accessory factor n=1 Tax=Acrocarpospora corrugata TaxID=35763 RepID=A0A5M3VPS7_9ACTN|nr:XdhC family protein [Acrocarpospora corrugata]GER98019.1 xanthine dehydrogenase accessory factor [Acrocarpospora corrugata]
MSHVHDASCAVAHGEAAPSEQPRTLVAVFASPMAGFLLKYATDLGYRTILLEPGPNRLPDLPDTKRVTEPTADFDDSTDVVITDHHRDGIGPILRDILAHPVRWIGIIGSPRHQGPHIQALTDLSVPPAEIARVHRPIGLDIGSRTPPEIAIATLAGLIADRNNRPGGFTFAR